MNSLCNVQGCNRTTYMGWRPLTKRRGRQICEKHWLRHKDKKDNFDLFEVFKFRRPEGIHKLIAKKDTSHCSCGRELLPGRRFCTACATERERQRKKRAYHEHNWGIDAEEDTITLHHQSDTKKLSTYQTLKDSINPKHSVGGGS